MSSVVGNVVSVESKTQRPLVSGRSGDFYHAAMFLPASRLALPKAAAGCRSPRRLRRTVVNTRLFFLRMRDREVAWSRMPVPGISSRWSF